MTAFRAIAARLVSEGLAAPVLTHDMDRGLNGQRFLRVELDEFVVRCLDDAQVVEAAPPGFDDLRRAAGRAEAGRASPAPSLHNAECAPCAAAERLKTTDRVVRALMADGPAGPTLPSPPLSNNRSATARVIPRDAHDAFDRDHVSLINQARERGAHLAALAAAP